MLSGHHISQILEYFVIALSLCNQTMEEIKKNRRTAFTMWFDYKKSVRLGTSHLDSESPRTGQSSDATYNQYHKPETVFEHRGDSTN